MIVRIEPNSPTPLYEQIASAIVAEISSGRLKTGEGLPAARHLAAALAVNMHTVLKAYERLKAAGVIEIRRGRSGAVVIDGGIVDVSSRELDPIIENLVVRAKAQGLKRGRLLEMIGDAW
jgi:DNA-binding transcriptional regulator YhcF (GntR family)